MGVLLGTIHITLHCKLCLHLLVDVVMQLSLWDGSQYPTSTHTKCKHNIACVPAQSVWHNSACTIFYECTGTQVILCSRSGASKCTVHSVSIAAVP